MTDKQVGFMNPTTLAEATECAKLMADSHMVPKNYQGKAGDILVAGQMGAELGVPWLQALQGICVINGNPSVWGDMALAIVKAHPQFEWIKESYDEDTRTATCIIKRRNEADPVTQTFSWADACQAGLNTKDTYQKYRRRMLQMRARSWAMRDCMPDALKGVKIAEEQMAIEGDYTVVDTPARGIEGLSEALAPTAAISGPKADAKHPEGSAEWWASLISDCTSLTQLEKVGFELRAADKDTSENLRGMFEKHADALRGVPTHEDVGADAEHPSEASDLQAAADELVTVDADLNAEGEISGPPSIKS